MKFKFLFKPLVDGVKELRRERAGIRKFNFAGKKQDAETKKYDTVSFNSIQVTKIKAFGFVHDLELTKKGTPSRFERWGYLLLNSGAYYRVTVETIRELQEGMKGRYQVDRKEEHTAVRNNKQIAAIDWHMSFIKAENKD